MDIAKFTRRVHKRLKFKKHCALAYKHLSHSELFWLQVIDNHSNQLKQNKKMYPNRESHKDPKEAAQMLSFEKGWAWRKGACRPLEALPLLSPGPCGPPWSLLCSAHLCLLSEQSCFLYYIHAGASLNPGPLATHTHTPHTHTPHTQTHAHTAPEFKCVPVSGLQSLKEHP